MVDGSRYLPVSLKTAHFDDEVAVASCGLEDEMENRTGRVEPKENAVHTYFANERRLRIRHRNKQGAGQPLNKTPSSAKPQLKAHQTQPLSTPSSKTA